MKKSVLLAIIAPLAVAACCFGQTVTREIPTYSAKMMKPKLSPDSSFEDPFIKIEFVVLQRILFKLKNKTDNPIEIDWGKVSYVDTEAGAHRVVHEGVRYIERDKVPAPTVVPPMANITDIIHPADYIDYESGSSGGWKIDDLFKNQEAQVGK